MDAGRFSGNVEDVHRTANGKACTPERLQWVPERMAATPGGAAVAAGRGGSGAPESQLHAAAAQAVRPDAVFSAAQLASLCPGTGQGAVRILSRN